MKMVTQKTQEIKPEEFVNAILQGTNAQAAEVLKAGGKLKTIPGFEDFATRSDVAEFFQRSVAYTYSYITRVFGISQDTFPGDVVYVRYSTKSDGKRPAFEAINISKEIVSRDDIRVSSVGKHKVSLCHTGCGSCDQVLISTNHPTMAFSARAILAMVVLVGHNGKPMSESMAKVYEAFLTSDYVKAFEESEDINHVEAETSCATCPVEFHKESPVMTKATKMPGMPEEHHAEVLPVNPDGNPTVTAVGFAPELIQLIMRTAINESVAAIMRHTRGV